jgi:hypothetical protein
MPSRLLPSDTAFPRRKELTVLSLLPKVSSDSLSLRAAALVARPTSPSVSAACAGLVSEYELRARMVNALMPMLI